MEEDGFKLVQRNKRPGRRRGKHFLERYNGLDDFAQSSTIMAIGTIRIDTAEELQEQMGKCRTELPGYLEQVRKSMEKCLAGKAKESLEFTEIVCFGLGNFTQSPIALYQLALLVEMKDELAYSKRIVLYDPCFSDFEVKALLSLGFHLLGENTECHYPTVTGGGRTLFYMPHMYSNHYSNTLQSNWHQLERIVLYGNSFELIMSLNDTAFEQGDAEYLLNLKNGQSDYQVEEQHVRNDFTLTDVFNNLSIHTFTKKKLKKI